MKQPKYKFGDMFQIPVSAMVSGVRLSGTASYYIYGIMSVPDGYQYKLTTSMPTSYWVEGVVETDWITEKQLERQYTHVPF